MTPDDHSGWGEPANEGQAVAPDLVEQAGSIMSDSMREVISSAFDKLPAVEAEMNNRKVASAATAAAEPSGDLPMQHITKKEQNPVRKPREEYAHKPFHPAQRYDTTSCKMDGVRAVVLNLGKPEDLLVYNRILNDSLVTAECNILDRRVEFHDGSFIAFVTYASMLYKKASDID